MREVNSCPCCGKLNIRTKKKFQFAHPGNDIQNNLKNISYVRLWILFDKILKIKNPIEFKIMICEDWGFVFLNPRLNEEEIKTKYEVTNELGDVKLRYSLNPPQNLEKRALRIYKLIKQHFPGNLENKKVLDYGGSWGYNLYPFLENNKAYILDYEKWEKYKEGINYVGHDFSSLENNDFFDVILILHTLEHVIHPFAFLKEAINHLSPKGLIYVEVPLGVFYEYRNLKDPITHLNFFSEESLAKIFQSLGLKIIHISTRNQWITVSKDLCINIIGIKDDHIQSDEKIKFHSTFFQTYNYFYLFPLILNKLCSRF